jgi:hypothetical protein
LKHDLQLQTRRFVTPEVILYLRRDHPLLMLLACLVFGAGAAALQLKGASAAAGEQENIHTTYIRFGSSFCWALIFNIFQGKLACKIANTNSHMAN